MHNLTPTQRYQQDLDEKNIQQDESQRKAIELCELLYNQLVASKRLFSWRKKKTENGIYFWGGVGRGKTYILDLFFQSLPFEKKWRVHFHSFMANVHERLENYKGKSDPLRYVARDLAHQYQVICFDEFFVSDIADAMLLGTLFQYLFEKQVVFVMTSNIVPDNLYKNGLQRARFIPAITLIKEHCHIFHLDSEKDYRLEFLEKSPTYFYPLSESTDETLRDYFETLTVGQLCSANPLIILGRDVPVLQHSLDVLLVSFEQLCDSPRSQRDYIELAQTYHTVLISDVRRMGVQLQGDDIARRFIALIDELYQHRVKVILSAEVDIPDLYQSGNLEFEFKRCVSRIIEMQSKQYFERSHHI